MPLALHHLHRISSSVSSDATSSHPSSSARRRRPSINPKKKKKARTTTASAAARPSPSSSPDAGWLETATEQVLAAPLGALAIRGKWHEAASLFSAWHAWNRNQLRRSVSSSSSNDNNPARSSEATAAPLPPRRMEDLLDRLLREHEHEHQESPHSSPSGRMVDVPWSEMNYQLLDAWAVRALLSHDGRDDDNHGVSDSSSRRSASARARQLLVEWQERHERGALVHGREDADPKGAIIPPTPPPTRESFDVVFHAVAKVEGPLIVRRLLAWMEHLAKSGKNGDALPNLRHYHVLLGLYASSAGSAGGITTANAGVLAESVVRHMLSIGIQPDTLCYNFLLKAVTKSSSSSNSNSNSGSRRGGGGPTNNAGGRSGRAVAEHAQSILESMAAEPDVFTYGTVIASWVASGMKTHAAERAEALVSNMQQRGLRPNTVVWNSIMSAWVKSKNPDAVRRTDEMLRMLEANAAAGLDDDCRPDVISYNTHLHALSSLASPTNDYARRADALLARMEGGMHQGAAAASSVEPNSFSYNIVIDAYARSNRGMAAAHTLRRLIQQRQNGLEPDTFSFNRVMAALTQDANATTTAGTTATAASPSSYASTMLDMAEKLLWYMDETFASGVHSRARPDVTSFATVLHAHAKQGSAERAQHILNTMKERSASYRGGGTVGTVGTVRPNRYCYNAVISAWAASGQGLVAARKAETLLEEMQASGERSLSPNSSTYNAVLKAWSQSGTRCCGAKAELYLQKMWDLYHAGNAKVKPNDFSYNTVRQHAPFGSRPCPSTCYRNVSSRFCSNFMAGNQRHIQEQKRSQGPACVALAAEDGQAVPGGEQGRPAK
jgi:Pentatricopeptide repeat domain/PPR repeat